MPTSTQQPGRDVGTYITVTETHGPASRTICGFLRIMALPNGDVMISAAPTNGATPTVLTLRGDVPLAEALDVLAAEGGILGALFGLREITDAADHDGRQDATGRGRSPGTA